MSPTPSDARCAQCEAPKDAAIHNLFTAEYSHEFVAPTRVDEAPEGEPELTGTFACPICGVDRPHDHDTETKFDWANRPWMVRAARAARERSAFEATIRESAVRGEMQVNRQSYIGRIYVARGENWPPSFFAFNESNLVYECPTTAAFHHVWSEAVRHTIKAMRNEAPPTPEQPAVTGEPDEEFIRKPQTATTGINAFAGKWRPNVSDKEFFERTQDNEGIAQTTSSSVRPTAGSDGSVAVQCDGDVRRFIDTLAAAGVGGNEGDTVFAKLAFYAKRLESELSTRDPVSRTLGATDSPREDGTDVDQLRSQLSSTRTALQRVREAAKALLANATSGRWNYALDERTMIVLLTDFAALRALTSSETDQ